MARHPLHQPRQCSHILFLLFSSDLPLTHLLRLGDTSFTLILSSSFLHLLFLQTFNPFLALLWFLSTLCLSVVIGDPHARQVVPHCERLITFPPPAVYTWASAATQIHYLPWGRAAHSSPLSSAASLSVWAPRHGRVRALRTDMLDKLGWRRTWHIQQRFLWEDHFCCLFRRRVYMRSFSSCP